MIIYIHIYNYTKGFSIHKKLMEDSYITTAVVLYSMSDKSQKAPQKIAMLIGESQTKRKQIIQNVEADNKTKDSEKINFTKMKKLFNLMFQITI